MKHTIVITIVILAITFIGLLIGRSYMRAKNNEPRYQPSQKRSVPIDIPPITYKGIRYIPSFLRTGGAVMGGGYINAIEGKTNKPVWDKFIYTIQYNSEMEMDVQDVFISKLFIENDRLVVIDEKNNRYELDPVSGKNLK